MKVLIFCLVLFGVALNVNTSEEIPSGCPADEDPRFPTHLPHATDCTKFWKCYNGIPYLIECEVGLYWSIENSWCDYPEYAKCVRPIPEDSGENGSEGGEQSSGGDNDLPTGCPPNEDPRYPTHLPHATDCDKFWKCWDGVPYLNECPQGQHWSIENTWCDYIENAKCIRPIPEDGGEDSGENGGETDLPTGCPPEEDPRYPTHLPHDTDCDKFWKCWNGVPYLNECPQGQHWSIENTWCDYVENVKCIRPIPEDGGENGGGEDSGEDSEEETVPHSDCPGEVDESGPAHLPHATDCTKFWQCVGGYAYLNECPSGLHWNNERQYCDYKENANCVRPLKEDMSETVLSVAAVAEGYSCPTEENTDTPVHLPHATDCTKFYKCFNGQPILQECPHGLEWNINGDYCDYASHSNCIRPLLENFSETEDLPDNCPPNEDPRYPTHLPHATDCDKFWKCWDGVPYLNECPQGQHWSIENTWCDYIENAKCVRPIPEDGGENGGEDSGEDSGENGGETDLPTGCPPEEDPRYPTHLPHDTDCDKFWKCWNGVPYLNECPQGQHWSIENTWCDYVENVKCIRPIPEDGGENGGGEDSGEDSEEETVPHSDCPGEVDESGPAHLPHATDCTKFWQCVGGYAYLNECPSGLHWNNERQYCDYKENANCVRSLKEVMSETVISVAAVAEGYSCPTEENTDTPVHLPHASDCTKFYKCFNGQPILQECPHGLEWNINGDYCDYASEANCIHHILY